MNDNEQLFEEEKAELTAESPEQHKPSKKINVQMILNILLFAGLILCLILIFTGKTNSRKLPAGGGTGMNIAFVNSDTLMSQYELFQDLKLDLEAETLKLSQDLNQKKKSLENQYISYQNKAQAGTISYDDARKTEESLARQQQELMNLSDLYTSQISEKEYAMSLRVYDSLNVVLELINDTTQYDYILGYTKGAGILYANPVHDITETVVEILNERYLTSKKNGDEEK